MTLIQKKLGIIGGGNMGEAFAGAMIQAELFSPDSIMVSEINSERRVQLKNRYAVTVTQNNTDVFNLCRIVVLAVKPQQMPAVLSAIACPETFAIPSRKLVISLAAGITLHKIESVLYAPLSEQDIQRLAIIRVMPNTPALVLEGMSGMSPNENADPEDIHLAKRMLNAMGSVLEFEERQLDAVTALSGSGPAYVFFLVESMVEAGVKVGLSPDEASFLTLKTLRGSLMLMEKTGETPEALRRKVTSPGGTTEAAFKVLTSRKVKETLIEAITAATQRAEALSR